MISNNYYLQPNIFLFKGTPFNLLIDLFYEKVIELNDDEIDYIIYCISNNLMEDVKYEALNVLLEQGVITDINMPRLNLDYYGIYELERVFFFAENSIYINEIIYSLRSISIGYIHLFLDSLTNDDIENIIENIRHLDLQCLDITVKYLNCAQDCLEKFYLSCRSLAKIFALNSENENLYSNKYVIKISKEYKPTRRPFNINFGKMIHINQSKWLKANNYNLSLYRTMFIKDNKISETPFSKSLGNSKQGIDEYFRLYKQNMALGLINNEQVIKCNKCTLKYICESFSPLKKVNNFQYEKEVYCKYNI